MNLVGKKNVYKCSECDNSFVTIDRDPGVTPFTTTCRRCNKALAYSSFYRVDQNLEPEFEWYYPGPEEIFNLSPGAFMHVMQGGLLLRPLLLDGPNKQQ
jgi:DNA-directed RNA polymerase subunit RPC12/RpoP